MKILRVRATKVGEKNLGLDMGYCIEGFAALPKAGHGWVVDRYMRNNTESDGIFRTSPVQSLDYNNPDEILVRTENSTWLVHVLEETAEF